MANRRLNLDLAPAVNPFIAGLHEMVGGGSRVPWGECNTCYQPTPWQFKFEHHSVLC
jgi:hypothetical protein